MVEHQPDMHETPVQSLAPETKQANSNDIIPRTGETKPKIHKDPHKSLKSQINTEKEKVRDIILPALKLHYKSWEYDSVIEHFIRNKTSKFEFLHLNQSINHSTDKYYKAMVVKSAQYLHIYKHTGWQKRSLRNKYKHAESTKFQPGHQEET